MKRALKLSLALAACAAYLCPSAGAQPAYLVKNIRPDGNADSSDATPIVQAGGKGYFAASSAFENHQLWRSDGTPAGTAMVHNASPYGVFNYFESGGELYFSADLDLRVLDPATDAVTRLAGVSLLSPLHELAGARYFTAFAPETGGELWRTDGAPQGTSLVADVNPGPAFGMTHIFGVVNGLILFVGNDGVFGNELWRSDGTAAGTFRINDIAAGGQDALNSGLNEILIDGNALYFPAESALGIEAWVSNGEAGGTFRLADIMPGGASAFPTTFTKALGKVYFGANGATGTELWQTDGSTFGTSLVATVDSSHGGSVRQILRLGNRLLVIPGGGSENEPTVSDGTPQGSFRLDLNPSGPSSPSGAVVAAGLAFFGAYPSDSSPPFLYMSDATVAGTQIVFDPISLQAIRIEGDPYAGAGFCYVESTDGVWKTDGTAPGTGKIWGPTGASAFSADFLGSIGDIVYFSIQDTDADDGVYARNEALDQTIRLTFDRAYESIGVIGNKLIFEPATGIAPFEPWATDGTPEGTQLLKDIANGDPFTGPQWLADLNGTLLFSAGDGVTGRELWKSDGTEGGTTLLKDLVVGLSGDPQYIASLNGKAFFSGATSDQGRELWVTDGTTAGTALFADISPGASGSDPSSLVRAGAFLFFSATVFPASGRELWRTDGTAGGTQMAADLRPGSASSMSHGAPIVAIGERVYFVASDGSNSGIWRSDGGPPSFTGVGTTGGVDFVDFAASGPYLFYTRDFRKLFRFDEETGESFIHDFEPSINRISSIAAANGSIYFGMDDGDGNYELWRSDGATSETFRVADINPGVIGSGAAPSLAINGGQTILLPALTSGSGMDWWVSDGSSIGTRLFQNVAPLALGSFPTQFTVSGSNVYFSATDGATGLEIWAAPLSSLAAPTITVQPRSQSANAGQTVGFAIEAVGPGPLAYQWSKDDAPIPDATAATLEIGPIAPEDAGVYVCHVVGSTAVTAASARATLTVFDPPVANLATFVEHTLPAAMYLGSTLNVGVTMRDTSGVSWSRPQGYALGVPSDPAGMIGGSGKFDLPPPPYVVPAVDGVHTFILQVTAPATPGSYTAQLRMTEGNGPFFGQTVELAIEAIERPNAAEAWEFFE